MKTTPTKRKKSAMGDVRRARLTAVLESAMKRVNTRTRVPGKRGPSTTAAFFSLVVPESDLIELRTRADDLTLGTCSEHAAMLAAAMRVGAKTPAA